MTNPRATWGGHGRVMGWARFVFRLPDGSPVIKTAYAAGLTDAAARSTDMWIRRDWTFERASWLTPDEAEAHQRAEWPTYTAWRERQTA